MSKKTALHKAAWRGNLSRVKALLERGAELDERAGDGNTPLALACHRSHPDTVKLFLEMGCNVNNADRDLDTPLHYSCYNGDVELVKVLIEHGADVNKQNRVRCTPVWNAVYSRHLDVVKILAEANADLEVTSVGFYQHHQGDREMQTVYCEGRSPLWVALHRNSPDIFLFLVMAGYKYFSEEWIYDRCFPTNNSNELIALCDKFLSGPPKLQVLIRRYVRQYTRSISKTTRTVINNLDIPSKLKQYLLLGDLL